jgi:uncharacterized protein YutE (UPF0331/DUF86 family)
MDIKKTKFLKLLPPPLIDDIICGNCLPIIGSGFSKNAIITNGVLPDWNELGRHFEKQIKDYQATDPIDAISAFVREYSKKELVKQLWSILKINSSKPSMVHLSLAKSNFKTIVTTNYDLLLEKSYEEIKRSYRLITNEKQLSINASNIENINVDIIKLHGDVNNPEDIIITEDEYDLFITMNPIFATYISNIFITKTPLFLGYSLNDPDLRQIWKIINSRLGELSGKGYTIKINPRESEIKKFDRRNVKVVSLPGRNEDYKIIIANLFDELTEYWNSQLPMKSYVSTDDQLSELTLPVQSLTRLCFFIASSKIISYYKSILFPIISQYGLTPITAFDLISSGDNIIAKISTLIDRSFLVIADLSTENVLNEVYLALNKNKKIIFISEDMEKIPTNLANFQIIMRQPKFPSYPDDIFLNRFKEILESIIMKDEKIINDEPRRLLEKKEYRAAIISAWSYLEFTLDQYIQIKNKQQDSTYIGNTLKILIINELISKDEYEHLRTMRNIRNKIVHSIISINKKDAIEAVESIMKIANRIDLNAHTYKK